MGVRSQATGNTILLVTLLTFIVASIATALPQDFTIKVDADGYTLDQDIRLFVSGPPNTAFKVRILTADVLILTKSG
ncbi:MAG: hypothetical protein JXB14_00845, partial [Candidatus Altiarchaeota archaeon]|nr:hypothetical protein [Candidatus Altiarchaeota archaeon]